MTDAANKRRVFFLGSPNKPEVAGVLADLREDGYLLVQREGRHNIYRANTERPMKRPEHAGYNMREFFVHMQSELNRAFSVVQKQASREFPRGM